jgi:pyruvate dehydrogenase E2 component (dihydrolipoamide acetyltransferase)
MAAELGVDLSAVAGSGAGGEILAADIERAASANASASQAASAAASTPVTHSAAATASQAASADASASGASAKAPATQAAVASGSVEPLTSVGRLMAERTTASWATIPHFFVQRDVDATALNQARAAALASVERSHGVKVTHTDLLVSLVARTLRAHPRLNASWSGGSIALNADVNVAIAMAVDNAVVTGVIRNADTLGLGEIATRRRELTERARAGRLQPADITGGTFTISNLGMFGVDAFTAIIVPPQAAILAVGAISDRVVPHDGTIAVRPYLTMTLSSDHRVVDGARAAAFLSDVVAAAQQPNGDLARS